MSLYARTGKRAFDAVCSLVGLVVLSPVLAAVAAVVAVSMGRPVLFTQPRAGLHGRTFRLYKFRTMSGAVRPEGGLRPDSERQTGAGSVLRSTSLDELPSLWNVLKGDMSLVGPRPLLVQYLPRYSAEQQRRHEVRPGLTGWAQVSGRNALTWSERLAFDVWYVDRVSLVFDIRILARTFWKVIRREGISPAGGPTMPEFTGQPGE